MKKLIITLKSEQRLFTSKGELNIHPWGIDAVTELMTRKVKLMIPWENILFIDEEL